MVSPDLTDLLFARMFERNGPGVNVLIRRTYAELHGVEPTPAEFEEIARSFDDAWDRRFHRHRPSTPFGAGSPFYVREGELPPGQENAIRILEDG